MEAKTNKISSPIGIDRAIIEALEAIISAKGSPAEAARHLVVNQSQINRWISGETKWMTPKVWQRLEPFLRPHLSSSPAPAAPEPAPRNPQEERTEDTMEAMMLDAFRSLPNKAKLAVLNCAVSGNPVCARPLDSRSTRSDSDAPKEKTA